jgi:hypothetical protein
MLSGWLARRVELALRIADSRSAHHENWRPVYRHRVPAARARRSNGKDIVSPTPAYIDPIAHAWRHCNPQAPLPSALATRAASSDVACSLYSSHGQIVSESSRTAEDIRPGLLSVAIEPRISPQPEEVSDGAVAE